MTKLAGSAAARALVLVLGNVPFGTCQQRAQHLARALCRHGRVAYVNPNRSFLQPWLRPPTNHEHVPAGFDLRVLEAPGGLPFARRVRAFHRFNHWLSGCKLRAFLSREPAPVPQAVIATFPDQWELVRQLPESVPVLYDIMDDFTLFLSPGQIEQHRQWHRRLLGRASKTLVSSQVLGGRHRQEAGGELAYLGNGIPADLLRRCGSAVPDPELADLPRPVLGYLGTISHWMDFETIERLALAWPEGSVVLVGPSEVTPPRLPRNVRFRPAVRESAIPGVLRSFDLGLIPFARRTAIDAVNPIKLYEYLAAGLPVLSADFAEMERFEGHATLYRDAADAVASARRLLAEPITAERCELRREFAARHTWEERAADLWELIREVAASASSALTPSGLTEIRTGIEA